MNGYSILSLLWLVLLSPACLAQAHLSFSVGEARTIVVNKDISSVFISSPDVADYQVIEQNKVVVFGRSVGVTTLIIFGEDGATLSNKNIFINRSLHEIQQKVDLEFPSSDITVYNVGDQVVLSGNVATEKIKDSANNVVGTLMGKKYTEQKLGWKNNDGELMVIDFMTKKTFEGLVNNIEVITTKQVNVKLSIAEVSHTFLEEFGIKYSDIFALTPGVFVRNLANRYSASDIISVVSAIGDDSVGQILAEPNLSVISGETASFLVGGELPVVTILDGGTNVSYKEFGIRLDVMVKVLSDDKIRLSLSPEVSSIDSQYANQTYNLPSLKTRKARTTVELGDGQSFVLGGLLSTEDRETISKIPFAGDIPVLGALFRHTGTERTKTELIIVATVNLVQPINSGQIQLPLMEKTTTLQRFFAIDSSYKKASSKYISPILATGGFKK
ncbi:MAG: pilus assembly protein N-terminal domain-containing protein [Aliivibrio sp.]|uniref:type II and III secretion system protein family protein n=1 Tax=Aliivibrio sp. TaxID=1872443 RepID=UPI001A44B47D|nr:pilus assembly protein N-terminal domain-containing protein [Aliivibrio sp.]